MGKFNISTPASSAGIMRFMDVKASKVQIDPKHFLVIAVVIIIAISLLRMILG
ncbi:MAG: preprotein translocase subunit Sec61beta [Candidatus Micrarchaeia archaeon]